MYACCLGEILLGLRLCFPWGRAWAIAQFVAVLGFSAALGGLAQSATGDGGVAIVADLQEGTHVLAACVFLVTAVASS